MALWGCGPEFTATTTDVDAAIGSNDGSDFDGARVDAPVPPVADGLLLWLRGDVGVTVSDGGVSAWADLSPYHLDARQTDSTRRPTLATMAPSGRSALAFDGEDFLDLPSGFADFSRGVSLFAVATFGADGRDREERNAAREIDEAARQVEKILAVESEREPARRRHDGQSRPERRIALSRIEVIAR